MPNLYIIAGCNGAGKTTASFTVFPEVLNCRQFVNADNIAYGLSPFDTDSVAFEAGRIMLQRINELLLSGEDFAIETTLSTRSYVSLVHKAKGLGYSVSLIFIWLSSPQIALQRVAERVASGGHNIPSDIVQRRYLKGIKNLFELFLPIVNDWMVVDNSDKILALLAEKNGSEIVIENAELWDKIKTSFA